ncbi:hypothetical protein ABNF97_02030 [Plantactinospora sp. B6F1]
MITPGDRRAAVGQRGAAPFVVPVDPERDEFCLLHPPTRRP